jgi:hypothetical protein
MKIGVAPIDPPSNKETTMDSLADSEGFAMDRVDIVGTPIKT